MEEKKNPSEWDRFEKLVDERWEAMMNGTEDKWLAEHTEEDEWMRAMMWKEAGKVSARDIAVLIGIVAAAVIALFAVSMRWLI